MSVSEVGVQSFLHRMNRRAPLSDHARDTFLALPARRETYATYRDIVREGDATKGCCLVAEGFVSRYKTLPNGGRQINSFHFAGEMVDLQSALLLIADHGIRTHVPTAVLVYDSTDILALSEEYPEWGRALWFDTLVDAAVFREWMLNVGRRSAISRVAHLLLELAWRSQELGLSDGRTFIMPVTQVDLADATGLSAVHTNRSLQRLRADGLIRTYGRKVVIEERAQMVSLSNFHEMYLHPEGPRLPVAA